MKELPHSTCSLCPTDEKNIFEAKNKRRNSTRPTYATSLQYYAHVPSQSLGAQHTVCMLTGLLISVAHLTAMMTGHRRVERESASATAAVMVTVTAKRELADEAAALLVCVLPPKKTMVVPLFSCCGNPAA